MARENTRTGGKPATEAIVPGDVCISIGKPPKKAPPGYEWRALTSVARLETGHTPSRKKPEYWGGDVPWIGIRDATGNHGRVIHATNENTNALGIANSSARILPAETVCLSRTASVGYVVVMGRPMATSQDFVNWVCSDELNPHYLKYALLLEQRALRMFAVGSVHSTIYFPEVKAFHLCLPSREVQDAIAATLGALDHKIELNRKMNATLEAIARELFRDWFVDFGPTRAKMDGRAPYLSPDLWPLFPDRLNGEGKPEGWAVSTIGDEVRVVGGSTPSTKDAEFWDGGINWATPKDLSNLAAPVLLETSRTISAAGLGKISSGLLPVGALLLSSRAPIGYLAIAEVPVAINQGFIGMICDKRVSNVYAWLWTLENMEAILAKANGSTFQEISKGNFRPLPVIVPSEPVLRAFDAVAKPIYERIAKNERESRTLSQTRDLLLPKLMSGETHLSGKERVV